VIKLVNGFGVVDMNKQSKRSSVEKQETELQRHTQSKMASTGVWGAGDGGKIGSTRVSRPCARESAYGGKREEVTVISPSMEKCQDCDFYLTRFRES